MLCCIYVGWLDISSVFLFFYVLHDMVKDGWVGKKSCLYNIKMANEQFDVKTYMEIYKEFNSEAEATTHFIETGRMENRIKNKNELIETLCKILHFDEVMYLHVNLQGDNFKPINEMVMSGMNALRLKNAKILKAGCEHYVSKLSQDFTTMQIINSYTVQLYKNKSAALWSAIDTYLNFDETYYANYYMVKDTIYDRKQLFIEWLTKGLYKGEIPNVKYVDSDKVIQDVKIALMNAGVDMDFIEKQYDAMMLQYCLSVNPEDQLLTSLSGKDRVVYTFFLSFAQLHLFFNQNELTQYNVDMKKMYESAMEVIRSCKVDSYLITSAKKYDDDLKLLIASQVKFKDTKLSKLSSVALQTVSFIRTVTDANFLNTFKKHNGIETEGDFKKDLILAIAQKIIKESKISNSNAQIIQLVINLIYNSNLDIRKARKMSKKEYLDSIKTTSIEILSNILSDAESRAENGTLEADINYFIESKNILKLTKLFNIILCAFLKK